MIRHSAKLFCLLFLVLIAQQRSSAQSAVGPQINCSSFSGSGPTATCTAFSLGQLAGVAAESFGASPSASASTNTTAIQSALNLGGTVTLSTCGTYQLNARVIIKSTTRLTIAPCVTIQRANAMNDSLLVSFAYANSGLVTPPSYVNGLSGCTPGTQTATSVVGSGGGQGGSGLVIVNASGPTAPIQIANTGAFYHSAPTSWTVTSCAGIGNFTGGGGTVGPNPSTAVTITYVSGMTASVAWTAHGFTAGQYVVLGGSSPTMFNGVFKITSITDANDFVVELYRLPTAGNTGSAFGLPADHDIYVDGGTWDGNQANQTFPAAQTTKAFNVLLGFGQNIHVLNMNCINGTKYCINIGAAVDSDTQNFGALNTQSDIIKFDGPLYNVWARNTHGYTGDDGVTFEDAIGAAFAGYIWTQGDVQNSGIDGTDIIGYTSGTAIAELYFSGANYMGGMTFRNIGGNTVGAATAVQGFVTNAGMDSLIVDRVTATALNTFRAGSTTGAYTVSSVALKHLDYNPINSTTASLVTVDSSGATAGTFGQLSLEDFNINNIAVPSSGTLNMIQFFGAANKFSMTHGAANCHSGCRLLVAFSSGAIGQMNIDGLYMPAGDQVFDLQGASNTPNVTIQNSTLGSSLSAAFVIRNNSTVNLINDLLSGTFSNGVFRTVNNVTLSFNSTGVSGMPTTPIVVASGTPLINSNVCNASGNCLVANLPSAASNLGLNRLVNDSTAIVTEGQTCAGAGTTVARATSIGGGWKCF